MPRRLHSSCSASTATGARLPFLWMRTLDRWMLKLVTPARVLRRAAGGVGRGEGDAGLVSRGAGTVSKSLASKGYNSSRRAAGGGGGVLTPAEPTWTGVEAVEEMYPHGVSRASSDPCATSVGAGEKSSRRAQERLPAGTPRAAEEGGGDLLDPGAHLGCEGAWIAGPSAPTQMMDARRRGGGERPREPAA
jgi:hypothetical protein